MRLLLDTHTVLWAATEPEKLSLRAAALIDDGDNELFVSAVSVAEMSIKIRMGKLPQLGSTVRSFVHQVLRRFDARELALSAAHAAEIEHLPRHHNDPFDWMLIAQSRVDDLPLMTNDRQIARYDLEVIW